MVTDVVCEQLVTKKKETKDYVMTVLILLCAVCLLVACLLVFFSGATILAPIAALGVFGIFLLTSKLIKKLYVEYEYCFVNGDLTIDKISGKEKRYRKAVINIRQVDEAGLVTPDFLASHKVISCGSAPDGENAMYIRDGKEYYVITPDKRVMRAMKSYFKPTLQRTVYADFKDEPVRTEKKEAAESDAE